MWCCEQLSGYISVVRALIPEKRQNFLCRQLRFPPQPAQKRLAARLGIILLREGGGIGGEG
jgi:hypothetical protein